jgi:hypothetical protein
VDSSCLSSAKTSLFRPAWKRNKPLSAWMVVDEGSLHGELRHPDHGNRAYGSEDRQDRSHNQWSDRHQQDQLHGDLIKEAGVGRGQTACGPACALPCQMLSERSKASPRVPSPPCLFAGYGSPGSLKFQLHHGPSQVAVDRLSSLSYSAGSNCRCPPRPSKTAGGDSRPARVNRRVVKPMD